MLCPQGLNIRHDELVNTPTWTMMALTEPGRSGKKQGHPQHKAGRRAHDEEKKRSSLIEDELEQTR
jgi:hypothetical protein